MQVNYKPPKNFTTSYSGNFMNTQGSGKIGASDEKGMFQNLRRGEPKPELDDGVPKAFTGNSCYSVAFPFYGKTPEVNKVPKKPFSPGYGDMKGLQSSYKTTFNGDGQEKHLKERTVEKERTKAHMRNQIGGSLKAKVPLPFKGESTAQKDFAKRGSDVVEKVLPFDMLGVPHGMSMYAKSSYQKMHDPKQVGGCMAARAQ